MVIVSSVGRGGSNYRHDVCLIQLMLNEWRQSRHMRLLAVDGIVGSLTIAAIEDFQKAETRITDGRIDRDGPTVRKLVPMYNGFVASYIIHGCRDLFQKFDGQMSSSKRTLPSDFNSSYLEIKQQVGTLGSIASTVPVVGARAAVFRPPVVIGVVIVDDITILILALLVLLFAMALIIAKPAIEELVRQLIILMSKIKDMVDELIEAIKEAARQNLRQFQRCKGLFDQIMALSAQILAEMEALKQLKPTDEFTRERLVRKLADDMQRLQDLARRFFDCMALSSMPLV
jgi:hypothetical protein